MKNRAAFLDRDGVINIDAGYVFKPQDFVFADRVARAIKMLNDMQYKVIVISNQSGIARGYFTETDVTALHDYVNEELGKSDAHIDAFYICPHLPEDRCNCRKPQPGMILRAAEDFNISLPDSWMAGDKPCDIECAGNAGVKAVKIKSRYGTSEGTEYDCLFDYVEICF